MRLTAQERHVDGLSRCPLGGESVLLLDVGRIAVLCAEQTPVLRRGALLRVASFRWRVSGRRRTNFVASRRRGWERESFWRETAAIRSAHSVDGEAFLTESLRETLPFELLVLRAPLLLELLPFHFVEVLRVLQQQLIQVQHFYRVTACHSILYSAQNLTQ